MPLTSTSRIRPLLLALAAATLATACAPSAALAQCTGQPGTSALEQYCEAVPSGDGGRQNPGAAGGSGGSNSGSGSAAGGPGASGATASQLNASGEDGRAVATLAGNGGSESGSGGPHGLSHSGGTGDGAQVTGPTAPDGSPLKAATQAASTGPIAGKAITWTLVGLTALGAIGALLLRRRSLGGDGDAGTPGP